jgi:uncharacterized protein DUF3164
MTETQDLTPAEDGSVMINGKTFLPDAKGRLVPIEAVKPQHKIEDEAVRKAMGFARDLSAQIARFLGHTFEDLSALDALLAQEYDVKRGGRKGNRTYMTHDGLMKIQVQVADLISFGPELQQAKALIDECLIEWTDEGRTEIKAIVLRAFNVDKEGQINKGELFSLMRLEIDDERWKRAMQAISDGIRVVGAKQYIRFYQRPDVTARWQTVTIDLAKA